MRLFVHVIVLSLVSVPEAAADWTLAAFLGASRTRETSLTLTQPGQGTNLTLFPVHYDSASFEAPLYYGYRIGLFPKSRWFGIEGELIHLKVIADTARVVNADGALGGLRVNGPRPMSAIVERFSITHGVNLVLINAVLRHQVPREADRRRARVAVVGRVGLGASIPHPESAINGEAYERYEWGAFSMQGAAGVELRLAGPLYVLSEYKLSRTVQEVTVAGGSASTPLVTHHLVAGLTTRFGS